MKYLMILTFGVCLLFASVPAMADQAADEAAIREVSRKIDAAFNSQDAKALVALYDETLEGWDGSAKGRVKQEKAFLEFFKLAKNVGQEPLEEIGIVFITPDVAIHKLRRQMTGMVDDEGNPIPDRKEMMARVFVKRNGKWLEAAWFSRPIEE